MKKKIILAYSGGLDTSVICKWLELKGYEVICFIANVGQREDFKAIKKKALLSGASKVYISDIREEFVKDYVFPSIAFNALYEGRYLLGTSLARPVIMKEMIKITKAEKANIIAHGATGKGNDQVRFEISAYALMPKVKIIAPWRMDEFNKLIPGRKEAIDFAKKYKIPVKATASKPWSSDENLLHISFEAGMLEDPNQKPREDMFEYSTSPLKAKNKVEKLTIEFEKGIPVKINNKKYSPISIVEKLNEYGGRNGIGRIDIVESRFVGMKSRGVYETPGGTILFQAHLDLETLTTDREVISLKNTLSLQFAEKVYNGFWFAPEMNCLLAFLKESQKRVTGKVHLELYKGNVIVVGRESKFSLYDEKIASMEDDQGSYNQQDAEGFIKLNALRLIKK